MTKKADIKNADCRRIHIFGRCICYCNRTGCVWCRKDFIKYVCYGILLSTASYNRAVPLMVPILSGIAYAIPKYQFKKMSQESVVERIRNE